MKFIALDMHVALMNSHNVPFPLPLLIVAGGLQVLGAMLLLSNRFVRFCALGFVLYVLIINVTLHDFWNFTGLVARHEVQNFIKNMGILAGLLVLAGATHWRAPSMLGLLKSDKAVSV
jgi:putative oxidoreductase